MSKIVIPYRNEIYPSVSIMTPGKVLGGVEKFIVDFAIHSKHKVEVVEYRSFNARVQNALIDADLIVMNKYSSALIDFCIAKNLNIVPLLHAAAGAVFSLVQAEKLKKLTDRGVRLFTVSDYCKQSWDRYAIRSSGEKLQWGETIVPPTFAIKPEKIDSAREISFVTVGRADTIKLPFFLNVMSKVVKDDSYRIYTSVDSTINKTKSDSYFESHNKAPDKVILNANHSKIMDGLLECGFYVSTCIYETFGISAFEAINRGLPVLYFTQKDGKLGHDEFCNRSNSRKTMKSNRQSITDAYNLFKGYSTQQRWDIAGELYEAYNLDVFKSKIDAFVDEALSIELKELPRSGLELFF